MRAPGIFWSNLATSSSFQVNEFQVKIWLKKASFIIAQLEIISYLIHQHYGAAF